MTSQTNIDGASMQSIVPLPFVPFYSSGGITIYNADCRKVLPWLESFDLLLTDPPYGIDESSKKHNALVSLSCARGTNGTGPIYGFRDNASCGKTRGP